ncbi:MAG: undecaprenyl-diphosphate phosphatase [Rhodospirillales bacterium]|nr:undecaprenyl-diphosphate phosphatase [Rhodospirillales bacterium]MCW8970863.1 undecaprenyl-diphosphate phosphatase [Rhodospirillales bacterium]MCW9002057.1 undecaprenyl-diphosphate phosphatase [Rhodospirillales bacterium]
MPILHMAVLAVIQGITEFLPISSSGHLVLVPIIAGWPDQGLMLDVAVHVGTLFAVMVYFWRDLWAMIVGLAQLVRGKRSVGARMAGQVIVATLPVVAAGFVLNSHYDDALRSMAVIGWATLGFGVLLWVSDHFGMTIRRIEHMGWGSAIIIGLSQVLALIPGTSRSGITITAARFFGFERREAARFSMLLSIPTIMGAGTLKGWELYQSGDAQLTTDAMMASGLAFVAALIAIAVMMSWLRRATFTAFVFYRILLGAGLLALVYS